jgi:glycerol-3-phosphate acyltransferase PlsY
MTVAVVAVVLALVGRVGVQAAVAAVLIGAIVVAAHADNIARLRDGTERRLGSG